MTSKGWCGPTRPLPRAVFVVEAMPDGIHPTCLSLGQHQHLRVLNATNVFGYAGVRITVQLAGAPRVVLSPGDRTTSSQ
jgi:hypothetical protein